MTTRTQSNTITITSGDVRQVFGLATTEMTIVCRKALNAVIDFDLDPALRDLSIMAINDAITGFCLTVYTGDRVIREYRYLISTDLRQSHGPGADQPPLGYIPDGAHIRLSCIPVNTPEAAAWITRLGWAPSSPLVYPDGAKHQIYGSYLSGSYGMTRSLLSAPGYDRPAPTTASSYGPNRKAR